MTVQTITTEIENFLATYSAMRFSVSMNPEGRFTASVYWPNGDVLRDKHCWAGADTLDAAIAGMVEKIAEAEKEAPQLTTAAECKAAVLDLIREHNAAPAAFRDAVDALPVKG